MPFSEPSQDLSFKVNDRNDRKYLSQQKTGPIKLSHKKPAKGKKLALIGWSIPSIEALDNLGRPYIVVSLPEFETYAKEHNIPFLKWNFNNQLNYQQILDHSQELSRQLKSLDVDHAIPIFEETVEWAGALNSYFREDPRIFNHSILFRDKAMMKRRAHIGGLRVGIFEEGLSKEDVLRFFHRVNRSLLRDHQQEPDPIHVKAFNKAGAAGHRIIRSEADIHQKLSAANFPCLMESHLEGIEISCEAFIQAGKVRFLNITEYVVFGYSMMAPPSPEIENLRPQIRDEVQKVVDVFDIDNGIIHPEFFISEDGTLYFGEVAYRIPGGHIFDLMKKTYHFNPYEAHILCCDPHTHDEEIKAIFPDEEKAKGHAGSFLVYPKTNMIKDVNLPKDLEDHPGFDKHTLHRPAVSKIQETEGYGNHLGTVFFYNEDYQHVKEPLSNYVDHDFFM